jgi:chromosome segregation ATPase
MAKTKAATQSDDQLALQEAIDAHADACRHRDEKRDALSATEEALVDLGGSLQNAEADLEAEIAEAGDLILEGEIAVLPDRAAVHAERIARLKSQIEFHVKLRDRLKTDFNSAALACKYAQDDLDRAKRPLLQAVSAGIATEIEGLEAKSSELRARLKGMANSTPGGIVSLRASQMVRGWVNPPSAEIMTNSPLFHRMNAWTLVYRAWRKALETDVAASPPEAP